jgi:hypothetical protein
MALSANQRQQQPPARRGFDWPGIIRIVLIQVLVLAALSGAFVRYLKWSSDAEWAAFVSASKSTAPDGKLYPRSELPLQAVKAPAAARSENLSERAGTCRGRLAGRDG